MKDILLKRKNNQIQNYNNNIQTLNINDKNNISNESESVIKNEDIKRQVINEKEINYTPIYQNLKSTGLVQSIPPTPFSIPLPLHYYLFTGKKKTPQMWSFLHCYLEQTE